MNRSLLTVTLSIALILAAGIDFTSCKSETTAVDQAGGQDFLPPAPAGKVWKLVWSDEFNGTVLDENTWETPVGPRRDGNWAREDGYLDGQGNLVIRTRKTDGKYYSGAVRTRRMFEHRYGYWVLPAAGSTPRWATGRPSGSFPIPA
ncbi:MAG: hypothetical protein V1794_12785 [Candidatus Glassbacteria bacterium]